MKKVALIFAGASIVVLLAMTIAATGNASGNPAKDVTFSKDVAPIFYKRCAECHRPGEIAPMSLMTYKEARPWGKAIREKVAEGVMPPWHADPAHGKFKNDRRLSPQEKATILNWVDSGMKEGYAKDLPSAPKFVEGWNIGKPDLVLTARDYQVPAEGTINYQYFLVPTNFKEDKWVQAAEVRPGNRAVVHHVIVFVSEPGEMMRHRGALARDGIQGLVGFAPGEAAIQLPNGQAKLVKAGSVLVFQMHYTTNGTAQKDQTSIGLIFAKTPVQKMQAGGAAMNRSFVIPPGDANFSVVSRYTFKQDSHITDLMPHMHLRGKDFEYKLIYPDGTSQILLAVPRWDFNWQTRYELAAPIAAPQGSRVECVAHFDNSTKNKWNPDATKAVRWGQQTWEEMMIGFVGFTLDDQNLLRPQASPAHQ
ncbi:MAG: thiol-disulfide isomerase [Acidobacteria bacterium]|nr:thiol-disulfide isomerase [Acidobacteriota bacterium]